MATADSFKRRFSAFLGRADDVLRYAKLGETGQEAPVTALPFDCPPPSPAGERRRPAWAVIQQTEEGEVNWIIETTGGVGDTAEPVEAAMSDRRRSAIRTRPAPWRRLRVNPADLRPGTATLRQLVVGIVGQAMLTARDQRATTMSRAEIRQVLNEGRA